LLITNAFKVTRNRDRGNEAAVEEHLRPIS